MAKLKSPLNERIEKARVSVASEKAKYDAFSKDPVGEFKKSHFKDYEIFCYFASNNHFWSVKRLDALLSKKRKLRHLKLITDVGSVACANPQGFSAFDFAFLNGYSESLDNLQKFFRDNTIFDENWVISRLHSCSGYVREAYLQYLIDHSEYHHTKYLNNVLVMCNDHIPSVRSAAVKYVTSSIPKCDKIALFELFPDINRLSYVGRIEKKQRECLLELYFNTLNNYLETEMIMNMEPEERLMLYRWYVDSPVTEWQGIVDKLYSLESNPRNKTFLFKVLISDASDPMPIYLLGMKSKFNQIRAIALQGYYDKIQDYWPGVEDLVLDRCSKVQDIAIYIMKKHKGVSVGTLLTPLIQPNSSIAVARGIFSWRHSCDENCARKLLENLKYYKGKKLAASIKACAAVLKDEGVEEYLKYLDNESNKVIMEAMRALSKTYIPEAKIRAVGSSAKTIRGKQNAEQLLKDQRERKRKLPYPYKDDQEGD